ncbi:hypothetical protein AM587_10016041 [Phytophthora nicotianae]|uniref:Uncharacterized protein n=1 Tax=Phytophthora nicotianae TaxID=4792 RepID=A0A0W8CX49_PHYNI|nr:hypothetical protein AM587_10016041 [Phytophthora nicotianae]
MATWTLLLLALLFSQVFADPHAKSSHENVASEADRRRFRWLDEGIAATGEVHDWGQQQSFCFYENSSLHIRMDPLNSTLQPALIQTLGQSREANALFNMTNATLWYLQSVAWPLRPVFWAWSELRVIVESPKANQLSYTFARTPGLLCRSVLKAALLTPGLKEYVPPYVVNAVENFLFFALAVPVTGFVIMPNLYRLGSWAISYLVYLWNREVLFGIPHLGKIYFAFFAFFGCVLVWWYQWGASAKSESEPQDEEEIEELGYLDDELPPLTSFQLIISRSLKILGMTLLFYSTSSTEASLLLILLVSLTRVFEIIATIAYFWYHFEKPGRHSSLISKSEYEKQGQTETEKALAQLQKYLKENPDELDKVREDNEIRLRRFTRGRNHLDVATQESMLARQRDQRRSVWSYCSIQ